MRYRKIYTGILIMLGIALRPGGLFAQQKIDPTLEVTREFDGAMLNIHKSALNTDIADSLKDFRIDFNYTIFDKPYKDLYEFTPIASAQIYRPEAEREPVFRLEGGVSFPFTPEAELWFRPNLKKGNLLNMELGYSGFWGDLPVAEFSRAENGFVKGEKSDADFTRFRAAADYAKYWKHDMLLASVNYGNGSGSYRNSLSHTFNTAGVSAKIRSLKENARRINYDVDFSWQYTDDSRSFDALSLKENLITAKVEAGPNFGRYNRFTVLLNSENVLYSGIQEYRYGIFEIMPRYRFEKGRFFLRAGIKLSGRYKSKDDTDKYHNPFFINAKVSFELVKKHLWLYGEIDGKNLINNYSYMLGRNFWIEQEADLKAAALPFEVQVGFKGSAASRFTYDIFAKYSTVDGLPQFVNLNNTNQLSIIYSDCDIFTFGTEMGFISKRFKGSARFTHSLFSDSGETASGHYGYAPTKLDFSAEYNCRERIFIGMSLKFRSRADIYDARYGNMELSAPSYTNLSVKIKYVFNHNFALFAQGCNLLDQTIMQCPVYIEKGISAGAGIIVKF